MNDAALLLHQYGLPALALLVFAKRMGVPVPAMPFFLLVGARGAHDPVFAVQAAVGACAAAVLADGLWFAGGRRFGSRMLALMCRISISPDTCISKSELAFERHGSVTVLMAKFIPGVAGLAPPFAGALGMAAARFTGLNLAGTALWIGSGVAAGWVLQAQVAGVVERLRHLGALAVPLLLLAVAAYLSFLFLRRALSTLAAHRAPRLEPHQVAQRMARGEPVLLLDVRPVGAIDGRIPGALHAGPDGMLGEHAPTQDRSVQLVVFCDCPGDASAARVAVMLGRRGWPAHVLSGGYGAWQAAGLPTESAPRRT